MPLWQEGDDPVPLFKAAEDNVRVGAALLHTADGESDDDGAADPDLDNPADLVLDREAFKRNARLLLRRKAHTGKRALRRRGGGGGGEDDEGCRPASGRPGTGATQLTQPED